MAPKSALAPAQHLKKSLFVRKSVYKTKDQRSKPTLMGKPRHLPVQLPADVARKRASPLSDSVAILVNLSIKVLIIKCVKLIA